MRSLVVFCFPVALVMLVTSSLEEGGYDNFKKKSNSDNIFFSELCTLTSGSVYDSTKLASYITLASYSPFQKHKQDPHTLHVCSNH